MKPFEMMNKKELLETVQRLAKRHELFQKFLEKHEDNRGCMSAGPVEKKLEWVVQAYHDKAVQAIEGAKEFRQMLIVEFKALELCLSMVGNAETHREKSARLRGVIEICQGAVDKLRREEFNFTNSYREWACLFKSDYPSRHYIERIRELEQERDDLKQKLSPPPTGENKSQEEAAF